MPARERTPGTKEADCLEHLELPLRGLASEGASALVGRALRDLPGVAAVTVRAVEQVVQVTYDPARVTADAIRERMHTAGLVHPERDAGAHGPERPRGDATR